MVLARKTAKAKIDGKIVDYDFCGKDRDDYGCVIGKIYLGVGVIHSVNGIRQTGENSYHLWRHRKLPVNGED